MEDRARLSSLLIGVALAFVSGCTPKIGDACLASTDCSQLGDRLCDTSQPQGYCTIFNCEPDTCPNSLCVGFNFQLDPACGVANDGRWGRFERTYCMSLCTVDSDCRDGYQCLPPVDRAGRIVDENPLGSAACMPVTTLPLPQPASTSPQVCEPVDAGTVGPPFQPDAGP